MKYLKFLVIGIFFGILMTKAEVVSWYRIYEMFKFESFHMFGILSSAVIIGLVAVWFIKKRNIRSIEGTPIKFNPKNMGVSRYLIGGIIFGLGWALTGACPGPMFVLLGQGASVIVVVLLSAVMGTFMYGLLRDKLPH